MKLKIRLRNYLIWFVMVSIMSLVLPYFWPSVFSFNWSDLKTMFIGMVIAICFIEICERIFKK